LNIFRKRIVLHPSHRDKAAYNAIKGYVPLSATKYNESVMTAKEHFAEIAGKSAGKIE